METHAPGLIHVLVLCRAQLAPLDRWRARQQLTKLVDDYRENRRSDIPDLDEWTAAFSKYLQVYPRNILLVQAFMTEIVKQVSVARLPDDQSILGVCVVKNDLQRLTMVIDHHRRLGIRRFAVVDNGSTDGTLEWLKSQPDIDTYLITTPFQSLRKYGWINRILALYGSNRWHLYFDSDEALVDPESETRSLTEFATQLDQLGHDRAAALLLDLYDEGEIYSLSEMDNRSITERYCWFDTDSYSKTGNKRGLVIKGGPRKRLFSPESEDSPLLIKYPLFKFQRGLIFESAHYLFPFRHDIPLSLVLLHYKFLPSDLKRHRQIAQEGSFQGGSREYKRYLQTYEAQSHLRFKYPGSARLNAAADLKVIDLLECLPASETNQEIQK
jgi:hypothetical protein